MRSGIGASTALVAAVFLGGMPAPAQASALTVRTTQGRVRGTALHHGLVGAFLGLSYAAPPTGRLRRRPPQPPLSWKGIRDATRFGAHCLQERVLGFLTTADLAKEGGGAAFARTRFSETLATREKKDEQWMASLGVLSIADLRSLPAEGIPVAARTRRAASGPSSTAGS
ncbi:MAG: carboxylesterase family protein [Terracidiphilus sp.]